MYKPVKKEPLSWLHIKKGSFQGVETIAYNFIEVFLNALLKGLMKGEDSMKNYEAHADKSISMEIFNWDKCEKTFITKQGLVIHTA